MGVELVPRRLKEIVMGVDLDMYLVVVLDKADRNWCDSFLSDDRDKVNEMALSKIGDIVKNGTLKREQVAEIVKVMTRPNVTVGVVIDAVHSAQERYSIVIDNVVQRAGDPSGKIARHMAADGMYKVLIRLIGERNAGLLEDCDDAKLRMDILVAMTAWEKAR